MLSNKVEIQLFCCSQSINKGDKIKGEEVDWTSSMHGELRKAYRILVGGLKGRCHTGGLTIAGRIALKLVLMKQE
jgi:hypothetical protein